jgi:hypothetical protein
VSDIPITEKLLLNAGGWQAMKPARELLKSGRVSEAKYEAPLLSGYVREGAKNYRSGLRIKSAIDVENLCSCWESRSAGKICAHSEVGSGVASKHLTFAEEERGSRASYRQFVSKTSADLLRHMRTATQRREVARAISATTSRMFPLSAPRKSSYRKDAST